MSDLAAIDDATLYAFLNAKWGKNTCEVCGIRQWNLGRTQELPWAAVPLVTALNVMSTSFWAIVPVMCGNCGNVKSLFLGTVQAWAATPEAAPLIADLRNKATNV